MTMPNEKEIDPNVQAYIDNVGWYIDTDNPTARGGVTTYNETMDFVVDYVSQHGRAPTLREISAWETSQNARENFTYNPESTMAKMGFSNFGEYMEAQKYGEVYGPGLGNLIPEGSTVLLKDSKPWLRTYDVNRYPGLMQDGKLREELFVDPRRGVMLPNADIVDYQSVYGVDPQIIKPEQVYPNYDRPVQGFGMQDALGIYGEQQVFQARLNDYLTRFNEDVTQKGNDINNQYNQRVASGEDEETVKAWYDSEYKKLAQAENEFHYQLDTSLKMLNQGVPIAQLPLYEAAKDVMGANVNNLMNMGMESLVEAEKKRVKSIPDWRGYGAGTGADSMANQGTGNPQADFASYVASLQVSPESKKWLLNKYWDYYNQWVASGKSMPFMQYLDRTLGG
jgi:hypothetical protein